MCDFVEFWGAFAHISHEHDSRSATRRQIGKFDAVDFVSYSFDIVTNRIIDVFMAQLRNDLRRRSIERIAFE